MRSGVASRAKCNKVLLRIVAAATAELLVVNFQVRHRAARLTSPTITAQDLFYGYFDLACVLLCGVLWSIPRYLK
jgi:hypothetical protein